MNQADNDNLMRRVADHEATAQERSVWERLCQQDPDLRVRFDAERRLRDAVRRVMLADAQPPADLERRVRDALRASTPRRAAPRPWRRRLVPSGLAAGILIIISASIVIGVLGRSTSPDRGPLRDRAGYLVEIFVDAHHWSLNNPSAWNEETRFLSLSDADVWLQEHLGRSATLPDLSGLGFDFAGGKPFGDGLQLQFEHASTRISFYIQDLRLVRNDAREVLNPGIAYRSRWAPGRGEISDAKASYLWISGSWLCALVDGDDPDQTLKLARAAGMPHGEVQDF